MEQTNEQGIISKPKKAELGELGKKLFVPQDLDDHCERCGRRNLVFRIDGSRRCRSCGYDTQNTNKEGEQQ